MMITECVCMCVRVCVCAGVRVCVCVRVRVRVRVRFRLGMLCLWVDVRACVFNEQIGTDQRAAWSMLYAHNTRQRS